MKGFPQWFFCPTVIYRGGPKAEKYGDAWDYAVLVSFPWRQILRRIFRRPATATIWALSTKGATGNDKRFDWAYAVPAFRWLRKLGFKPTWERMCDDLEREERTD